MSAHGVAANVAAYSKRADSYDGVHPEIFNAHEQQRLRLALQAAQAAIQSDGRRACDYGCGTGNLTRHLLDLGLDVTAADVTPRFLRIVEECYRVETVELVGGDADALPDDFDLIALYSVLHHIPDYLASVRALTEKLRPGGVLFIDHEANDHHWDPPLELRTFHALNARARTGAFWDPPHKRWQHLMRAAVVPSRHRARLRRMRRITDEGDIHIWPDDHIEWGPLLATLEDSGMEIVERKDYLHFVDGYDEGLWQDWRGRCDDYSGVLARRVLGRPGVRAALAATKRNGTF